MLNIKTIKQGSLLLLTQDCQFYNESVPKENEKNFLPWDGINKKYNNLNLHSRGHLYNLRSGDAVIFLDFLQRIYHKRDFSYYNTEEIKYYQIGLLLMHGKNNVFYCLNTIRFDVFDELPSDLKENMYKTFLFKEL